MAKDQIDLSSWRYYLSLEKQFLATIDFVEIGEANSSTYSNEYAKLLLLIGSEVDVVAKQLCRLISPCANPDSILKYQEIIVSGFDEFHETEVGSSSFPISTKPWSNWGDSPPQSPSWWCAYNDVKHHRDNKFNLANQKNTIDALGGLLVIHICYYVALTKKRDTPSPAPRLLDNGFPGYLITEGEIQHRIKPNFL